MFASLSSAQVDPPRKFALKSIFTLSGFGDCDSITTELSVTAFCIQFPLASSEYPLGHVQLFVVVFKTFGAVQTIPKVTVAVF